MIEIVCTNGFTRLYEWFYSSVQMGKLVCTNGFTRYWKRFLGAFRLPWVAVGDKGRLALRLLYKVGVVGGEGFLPHQLL